MGVMIGVNISFLLVTVLLAVAVLTPRNGTVRGTFAAKGKASAARLLLIALLCASAAGALTAQETPPPVPPGATPSAVPSQPPALTNEEIVQMVKANFAEETILKAIKLSETRFDTSAAALLGLKNAGVSEAIIQAMLSSKAAKTEAPAPPEKDPFVPDDVGVYYLHNDRLEEMHPELVTWRTGGVAKSLFLGTKGHINGVLKGTQSKLKVGTPLEFVVRCPESVDITEYMLIRLDVKPDRREFRALTGGFIHASSGLERNNVAFTFEKIAPRTYRTRLSDVPKGEYGFLPPGGQFGATGGGASGAIIMQGAATAGKIYTFCVAE